MRVGIATDHGGSGLKQEFVAHLRAAGHEVIDFGAHSLNPTDDYPDFVVPLARGGLVGSVRVSRSGAHGGRTGSFDDIAPAAIDRSGHSSGGVHVGRAVQGHCWGSQGENDRDRRHHA